ncbi:MAG: S49 family peptidase [Bradyrhizobium sp.]|uniref:S49 family peptidase n=1 Tax=Bradyrhizobium sp. TaxID=376 RepID=UPI0027310EA7|nr:S49 family peptidase [Bradyrhizobium sp.]MDP1866992.1 S49 family peptidase [Bradyrhizobium sp.]
MTNPLLARFADVPALIDPRSGGRFEADMAAILRHPRSDELMASVNMSGAGDGFWYAADDWRSAYRPYVVVDGILQVPVKGVLLYDFPWALGSWATGYAYIARAIERGLADGNVRGIALIVYSYGGQGDGCFDLVNKIYAGRSVKPIKAFAQMAYSAGYAVACAASAITASSNAGIGSIGVVMTHLDVSRALESAGMKFTFVHFGKHKVDGNSYQPLPDEVKARWQSWCDETGEEFCALVARNRGIDIAAVRATEAQCFHASEAKSLGLIDAIAPLDDAVTAFSPELSNPDDDEQGDSHMSTTASVPAAGQATAALETARTEGLAAGRLEGAKEGATAERSRISAILGSDEAKGRSTLAHYLAFETDMSADAAKTMLAKAEKQAEPAATTDALGAAMSQLQNPTVGADTEAGGDKDDAALASAAVKSFLGNRAA